MNLNGILICLIKPVRSGKSSESLVKENKTEVPELTAVVEVVVKKSSDSDKKAKSKASK